MNPHNRDDIWQFVCEYTPSDLLRKHMLAVEAAMQWYARKFGADENLWGNIGLVHDFAYEKFPDQHPQRDGEILQELGWSDELVRVIWSHGDALNLPRVTPLEKTLYAVDELTGLIIAVALVRPSKKLADVDLASVKKKWKDKAFARGVNRADIERGAAELGVPLDEHIGNVLAALQAHAAHLGV